MKRNIYLMYIISFLQGMVFYASIATLYRTNAGLSVFQITTIESISYILAILLEFPWGIVADKIGYKKAYVICCVLYLISKIIFWQATGFALFLLERIILSVVYAGLSGIDSSIIYLSSEENKSQHHFSIWGGVGTAGMIVSAIITATFVQDHYRLAAFLTVIPYGIAAFLAFFINEVKENDEKKEKKELLETMKCIVKDRNLIRIALAGGIMSETTHLLAVFLNQIKYEAVGMNTSMITAVYILMTVLGTIEFFSGRITKRVGQKKAVILFYSLAIVGSGAMLAASSALPAVTAVACIEVSFALFQPLFSSMEHDAIHMENRATAVSMLAVFMNLIAAFIDLFMGRMADISLNVSILSGVVMLVIGLLLMPFEKMRGKQ